MSVDPADEPERGRELHVLVVDDHVAVRDGLTALLTTDPRIVVVDQATGETAVGAVRQRRPDVIIMDLSMPIVDGAAATLALARDGCDVPVLLMTGRPDADRIQAALEAGAVGFLTKDVDPDELLSTVHAAADRQLPVQGGRQPA
jgi:DNA-binding NarL/FixJ family response regulator